jgi:hypothetical protein
MKRARFIESQIVAILKEADAGLPVGDVIRKHGSVRRVTTSGRPSTAGWMLRSSKGLRCWRGGWRRVIIP